MNELQIVFSEIEVNAAKTLLNKISTSSEFGTRKSNIPYYQNEDFITLTEFEWQPFSQFVSCSFSDIKWNGIKSNNLSINDSSFRNCTFENSNLKYTNFNKSNIQISAKATAFDYSDYSNAVISDSNFLGCSFTGCLFLESEFNSCTFCEVEFTDATFINVSFKSIDFSKTSMENSEFRNCTFINCILPYFEIIRISNGLNEILQNDSLIFKPAYGNYTVKLQQYLYELHELLPIFYSNRDFISLANIYLFEGNSDAAYFSIVNGIKYACQIKDFKMINNLCKLAATNNFFTPKQLKWFYKMFKNNISMSDLNLVERHRYLNELSNAEKILLNFSTNPNIMYITLETNYCYKDTKKLALTLEKIYEVIDLLNPELGNSIVIRHNSPPILDVSVCGELYSLFFVFGCIVYIFNKSISYIAKVQQLIKNRNDLKIQELEIKVKELEIAQKEKELQNPSTILLPEDFKNISYIMKTDSSCPKNLLSFNTYTGISDR